MSEPTTAGPIDLTPDQVTTLLAPLNANRVQELRGMAHLEAWDVRRWLNRVFGFGGWSAQTLELVCISEREIKPNRWTVVYRAQIRLTVKTTDGRVVSAWDDAAMGDSRNQPSLGDAHDMAMKTALSQALKRCAVNLGDGFGLSLYNNGSTRPVTVWSAAHPAVKEEVPAVEDEPVNPEPVPQQSEMRRQEPQPAGSVVAQTIADTAAQTADVEAVRSLYRQAQEKGLLNLPVTVFEETAELRTYLVSRGNDLTTQTAETPAPEPVEEPKVPEDGYEAAMAAVREWARENGREDTIEADIAEALGTSLVDASTEQIWDWLARMQSA